MPAGDHETPYSQVREEIYPPPQRLPPPLVGKGQEYGLVPVFKSALGANLRGDIAKGLSHKFVPHYLTAGDTTA